MDLRHDAKRLLRARGADMRGADAVDTARDRKIAAHTRWPVPLDQARSVNCLRSLANGHLVIRILDQFSIGVVLLDQFARVLFANAAAQSLAESGNPLGVDSGVTDLSPSMPADLATPFALCCWAPSSAR